MWGQSFGMVRLSKVCLGYIRLCWVFTFYMQIFLQVLVFHSTNGHVENKIEKDLANKNF